MNLGEHPLPSSLKSYLLDPLSVIVKLAILGNKPVGTKILIHENKIFFQEPGLFQGVARCWMKTNKSDLHHLFNPVVIACRHFLTDDTMAKIPRLSLLFQCAQRGLHRLCDTYKQCMVLNQCLIYFNAIIDNHLQQKRDIYITADATTCFYTDVLVTSLNHLWSDTRINVVLDLIAYLNQTAMAEQNVRSLETIMDNNDLLFRDILARA